MTLREIPLETQNPLFGEIIARISMELCAKYHWRREIRSLETAFLVALNEVARNTIGDDEIRSLETAFLAVRKIIP